MASRQTATATSILRVLLAAAGKDIRLKTDGVSNIDSTLSNVLCQIFAFPKSKVHEMVASGRLI